MTIETSAAATTAPPAESAPATQPGAETPDGLKEQAGASPEGETEQPKEGEAKSGTPRGVQKRLDELTRQRAEAQRVNERLLGILEQTLTKGEVPKAEVPAGPPKRESFETYEAYLEAKADYQISQKLGEVTQKVEAARQQAAAQQRESTWTQRVQKAASEIEDFADVVFSDALTISPAMAEAMKDSEMGPQIAYHLGKNTSEAQRIAQLSPAAQVREIGKIEARLEAKKAEPAKQPSKAPPPIDPVGGGKGGGSTNLDSMSQKEYEAMRAKQGASWARPIKG